jgi:para-aminobenzoate synthetase component 1
MRDLVGALRSVLTDDVSGRSVPQALPGFLYFGNRTFSRPLATVSYWGAYATVSGPEGSTKLAASGFDLLQAMLEAWQGLSGAFLAGFISYDLAAGLEDLGPAPGGSFEFPKFHFGLYDSVGEAAQALACEARPALNSELNEGPIQSKPDRACFEAAVARIVERIHAGDIFQTNLCRCIEAPLGSGAEWELYQRMRSISPAQYEAFLRIDSQRSILSVSPELFLAVNQGVVESSPIKGTRPRGGCAEQDQLLLKELVSSEKDRAELAMIVDVVRNDLARVCRPGTVEVVKHAASMSLPTVHHLFSTVRGRLRQDRGLVDLLKAAFPAASITGAPKIEAMRVAMREEGQLRGPCMGAIGWISMDGRMELSVAIRTAFVADGRVRYYAGCGITAGSVPADEFVESTHKAAAFLKALNPNPAVTAPA